MKFTPVDYMFSDRLHIFRAIDEEYPEIVHIYIPSIGFVRKTEGDFIYNIETITLDNISDTMHILNGLSDDDMNTIQYKTIFNLMRIINHYNTDSTDNDCNDMLGISVYTSDIANLFKNDPKDGMTIVSILIDFSVYKNGIFDRIFTNEYEDGNLKQAKPYDIIIAHILDILTDYYITLDYTKDVFTKLGANGNIEFIIDSHISEFLEIIHEYYYILSLKPEDEKTIKAEISKDFKEFMGDTHFLYEDIYGKFNHVEVFEEMLKNGKYLHEFSENDYNEKESYKDTNSSIAIDLMNDIIDSYK